jgi:hypothetical protein
MCKTFHIVLAVKPHSDVSVTTLSIGLKYVMVPEPYMGTPDIKTGHGRLLYIKIYFLKYLQHFCESKMFFCFLV